MGFELFGLRVQVCSQLVQFMLMRKAYDNHHCHNKPQTGNEAGVWMTSCPEEMGWEFGRFWKRFSWGPTMVLRGWGPNMQLRIWDWTMQADNWASALGAENGFLCHSVEFSTVVVAVKFFGLRPAKMNWDLKHHEMSRMLGGVVSIVWLRKSFKNCLSPCVEEPKSEVNKFIRTWTMEFTCFRLCVIFAYVYV